MSDPLVSPLSLQSLTAGLFDQSSIPTVVLERDSLRIAAVNGAGVRLLGWPRSHLVGRTSDELVGDPIDAHALRRLGRPGSGGIGVRKIFTAAGVRLAEVHTPSSTCDEAGHFFVQFIDITDTIGAATSPSPTTTDTADDVGAGTVSEPGRPAGRPTAGDDIGDAAPLGSVAVDLATGLVIWCNRAFSLPVGRDQSQLTGTPLAAVVTSPDAPDIVGTLRRFGGSIRQPVVLAGHPATAYGSADADGGRAIIQFVLDARVAPSLVDAGDWPVVGDGPTRRNRLAQRVLGIVVALLGAATVFGWWTGTEGLVHLSAQLEPMSPAAGLAFVGFGLWLSDPVPRAGRLLRSLPLMCIAVLSGLTVISRTVDGAFSVDDLLRVADEVAPDFDPSQTSIGGALVLAALAGAQLLRLWAPRRSVLVVQALLTAATSMVLLSALGYLYSALEGELLARSAGTAILTVVCLLLVCVASWLPVARTGIFTQMARPMAGGRFARRAMSTGLVAVIVTTAAGIALRRWDVVGNAALEHAAGSVGVIVVMFGFFVHTSGRVNGLDDLAAQARQDLETVLAAFSDRHFRIGANGLARPVTGARQSSSTPAAALVPPETRERLMAAIAAARTTRVGRRWTYQSDHDARLEVRIEPLSGDSVAMSIYDVSELAAVTDSLAALTESLEDEVRARTAELERTNADLEQFAYLASHDLQEPLRMVSTFVNKLAAHVGDLDERGRTYVEFAVDGAQRMSELIEGLLHYSRAGREPLAVADVDLSAAVSVVVQSLWAPIEATGGVVAVSSTLPRVRADETLLRQILQNLIANSLCFVERDHAPVIDITAIEDGDMVEISVTDNGIGVPPRFGEQVFQMFRRLNSRSAYPGTGIGLSLVQRLVEAHGGRIWLDTDYGPPGARFCFTLPAAGTYTMSRQHHDPA